MDARTPMPPRAQGGHACRRACRGGCSSPRLGRTGRGRAHHPRLPLPRSALPPPSTSPHSRPASSSPPPPPPSPPPLTHLSTAGRRRRRWRRCRCRCRCRFRCRCRCRRRPPRPPQLFSLAPELPLGAAGPCCCGAVVCGTMPPIPRPLTLVSHRRRLKPGAVSCLLFKNHAKGRLKRLGGLERLSLLGAWPVTPLASEDCV